MQRILTKGLLATEGAWEPLKQVYGWIHQLAQVLDETEEMQVEDQIPDLPRTNNDREQTFEQVRAHERMATMS